MAALWGCTLRASPLLLAAALGASGCLAPFQTDDCTSNAECRGAFGFNQVCGDEGFCESFVPPDRCDAAWPDDLWFFPENYNDAHVIGMSSLAAGHKTLLPQLIGELKKLDREDIMVIVGGVIPSQDYDFLLENGAAAIFGPGTVIPTAARKILEELEKRIGD